MARSLRIEYKGAWHHVMNRGLERRRIFFNDGERTLHYHLLVHTPLAGLGRAMRNLFYKR